MATVDKALLWIALALFLVGGIAGIDLLFAIEAQACPAPDCYPWGAEGPPAEDWRYQNKELYLASGLALLGMPAVAAIASLHGTLNGQSLSAARRIVVAALNASSAGLLAL